MAQDALEVDRIVVEGGRGVGFAVGAFPAEPSRTAGGAGGVAGCARWYVAPPRRGRRGMEQWKVVYETARRVHPERWAGGIRYAIPSHAP